MTSLTARPSTSTLPARGRPGVLSILADIGALTAEAFRAARAYEGARSTTARRRVLDDFAAGAHRAA